MGSEVDAALVSYLLTAVRLAAAFFCLGFFRSVVSVPGLVLIVAALALVGQPSPQLTTVTVATFIAELSFGVSLGLLLATALESFAQLGRVVDVIRGAQLAEQYSLISMGGATPFEQLAVISAVQLSLSTGWYQRPINLLLHPPNFSARALDHLPLPALGLWERNLIALMPLITTVALMDLFFAIVGRLYPRLGVQAELAVLKLLIPIIGLGIIAESRLNWLI